MAVAGSTAPALLIKCDAEGRYIIAHRENRPTATMPATVEDAAELLREYGRVVIPARLRADLARHLNRPIQNLELISRAHA